MGSDDIEADMFGVDRRHEVSLAHLCWLQPRSKPYADVMAEPLPPVACTLTTKAAAAQLMEWDELRSHAVRVERVDGGAKLVLPGELAPNIYDLAAREADCCAFLTIETKRVGVEVELAITSAHPHAGPVIDLIAGFDNDH